jgi:hypothetical protein
MGAVTTVYVPLLVVSFVPMVAALYAVLDNLDRRGGKPLAVMLGSTLVWTLGQLVGTTATEYTVALYANRFMYFGVTGVTFGWFLFALLYTDYDRYVNTASVGLLLVEPLAVLGLVFTNTRQDIWVSDVVARGETLESATLACDAAICYGSSGPAFLAHTLYSYLLLGIGAVLVLRRVSDSDALHRAGVVSMVVGVLVPTLGNALSLFVLPDGAPDLTPVTFGVAGVAIVLALYRYSVVDSGPLASQANVDDRDQPAFLVDDQDTFVDCNVAGAAVLGVDADVATGSDVDAAFADQPALHDRYRDGGDVEGLELTDDLSGESYTIHTESVTAPNRTREGTLFLLENAD